MNRVDKQMQHYIHLSKYSRWLDIGRRETWDETVDRTAIFWKKKFPFMEDVIDTSVESMRSLESVGSMRTLMTAGHALDRDNAAGFNCAAIAINDQRVFDEIFYLLMCGCGVGFSVERQYINQLPVVPEPIFKVKHIHVRDSKIGWAESLRDLIDALYKGESPTWDVSDVRPAGARLKTFGGRASGPEPLENLFKYVAKVFCRAHGRKLNSLECHDIICKIADAVIVGSVRRSACISLSNLTDARMARAKLGEWYLTEPQRMLANNSVAYTEKPDLAAFTEEMRNLYASKAGERGIVNKVALKQKAIETGRVHNGDYLLNPCVSPDTYILTKEYGHVPIVDVAGKIVNVWNGEEWSAVEPNVTGYNQKMVSVGVSSGQTLDCTLYHKFILSDGSRVEASQLKVGDKLLKHHLPVIAGGEVVSEKEMYTRGFFCGDGCSTSKGAQYIYLYGEKKQLLNKLIYSSKTEGTCGRYQLCNYNYKGYSKKYVPGIEVSVKSRLDYLAGLIDSDGSLNSIDGALNITSVDKDFLLEVQRMLQTVGTHCHVALMRSACTKEMPDGRGGSKEYSCKDCYRIIINASNVKVLRDMGLTTNRVDISKASPNRNASRFVKVTSIAFIEDCPVVYCFTEEKNHSGIFNGIITAQCGEAILRDTGGFCNLSEVIIRPEDSLETLSKKVASATVFGTLQASLSDFRYLRDIWKDNQVEERLLGVSLTGIMDHPLMNGSQGFPDLISALKVLHKVAHKTNQEIARLIHIPPSKHVTLIKPSGTVSQLCGTSSGIHPRYAKFYLRRVTQDNKDPLTDLMISQGIPHIVRGEKTIFSFPIKSPEGAICARDMGAIDQLELWKVYREYWCDGNPSQTIYYTDNDFLDMQAWVYKNWDIVGGLSFFPIDDFVYDEATQPYLEITEERYNKEYANFPEVVHWDKLSDFEKEDGTTSHQTLSCAGGQCEL